MQNSKHTVQANFRWPPSSGKQCRHSLPAIILQPQCDGEPDQQRCNSKAEQPWISREEWLIHCFCLVVLSFRSERQAKLRDQIAVHFRRVLGVDSCSQDSGHRVREAAAVHSKSPQMAVLQGAAHPSNCWVVTAKASQF